MRNRLKIFANLFKKKARDIIIVSGLPRSGTSMMMKMLAAGGLEILTDQERAADEDNPQGYFELEQVKRLPQGDTAWMDQAQGKVVKIISQLLLALPDTHSYKILFMRRNMAEVLASQRKMLERRGEDPNRIQDEEMTRLFESHLRQVFAFIASHPNMAVLETDYQQILRSPRPEVEKIAAFVGGDLDQQAMAAAVNPDLYRQRS